MKREEIFSWIIDYVAEYPKAHSVATVWKKPICGVASAYDSMYKDLKKIVGDWHMLPTEILPEAKSVIAFFIPFSENIGKSNIEGEESSTEWDVAYLETNKMIGELVTYLRRKVIDAGYNAAELPPTFEFEKDGVILTSNWSHRSSAYIAGLGKFGINNMLITDEGCCGRYGSLITNIDLIPTERPKGEYCLYKHNGSCGKCMERCPNNVFSVKDGQVQYDRKKCAEQLYDKIVVSYDLGAADTCGKCMVGVPCSYKNPSSMLQK